MALLMNALINEDQRGDWSALIYGDRSTQPAVVNSPWWRQGLPDYIAKNTYFNSMIKDGLGQCIPPWLFGPPWVDAVRRRVRPKTVLL